MEIIKSVKKRLIEAEEENKRLKEELGKARAIIDYIGVCDYPEIFDEEEEVENE